MEDSYNSFKQEIENIGNNKDNITQDAYFGFSANYPYYYD